MLFILHPSSFILPLSLETCSESFLAEIVSRQGDWLASGVIRFFSFFVLKALPVLPFVLNAKSKTGRVFLLTNTNLKQLISIIYRRKIAATWFLLAVFALVGCKTETANTNQNAATREITDDLGRRVRLPEKVTSAVSLAPNLTEITFAVGAGDRLIGVTSFCDYPEDAKKIRRIGDTLTPNLETIVALKPQIVLVTTASQMENFTRTLDEQNIAYFVTNPNSLDDIYKSIYQIGDVFGTNDKAFALVDDLKRRVADVETRTAAAKDVKVFVQIDKNALYTIGKDSFITDLINRAGGESLTKNETQAYPKISKETALAMNPETIILSESENNNAPNDVFANSPAVKNAKVYKIPADLLSRPGPRVVDGLEMLAKSLHPESFR